MLSLFPFALSFGLFAPTLLRIALSITLAHAAWKSLGDPVMKTRLLGITETLAAALLLIGLWTQAAALLSAIITSIWYFTSTKTYPRSTVLFAFAVSLSLIVLGAGRIAFDLPF